MFRPSLALSAALAAVAVALGGCGGSDPQSNGTASPGTTTRAEQAAVLVTRNCGADVLVERTEVPSGQTAMQALDRVADVEAESGGKFVTEIEGVSQDTKKKLAWLYYVNGKPAQKGATEVKLAPGDVEWWDLHNYEKECKSIPAAAR